MITLFLGIQLDIYFKNETNWKFFINLHKDDKRINSIIDHYIILDDCTYFNNCK
jgi:hypothetical protein